MKYRYITNKIVFIILNYKTYWETQNCVQSIYDTIGENFIADKTHEVVIVDNGSDNGSYEILEKLYNKIDGIHIIKSEKNLGFAKGNNIGFKYAKENLNPQFITMINSDIIFNDTGFCQKLYYAYEQCAFAVAGPNVFNPSGENLNPGYSTIRGLSEVELTIEELKKKINLCKLNLEIPYIFFSKIKGAFQRNKSQKDNTKSIASCFEKLDTNDSYVLHGCFLIFSNDYISLFDGLYDKTFLYFEETLLRLRCKRAGLSMYYLSEISALHNESRTEKHLNVNLKKRHILRYTNSINSLNIVREYLLDENVV